MGIERHYNGHELAELLGVDYETVLHMAQTGEIESVRVGRLRRFPESAVLDYLDRQRDRNVIPLRPRDTSPPRRKEAR
jgi:excisionase family DNA binding protein